MDYRGIAVDLAEDFTVAASNVITTLAFGKEVSVCPQTLQLALLSLGCIKIQVSVFNSMIRGPWSCSSCTIA